MSLTHSAFSRYNCNATVVGNESRAAFVLEATSVGDILETKALEGAAIDRHETAVVDVHCTGWNRDGSLVAKQRIAMLVDDSPLSVQSETSAANESLAGRCVDDEEAVAVEREVERISRLCQVALTHVDGSIGCGQRITHHAGESRFGLEAARGGVGEIVGEHLLSSLAIAAVTTVAIQQFFGDLLRVPLPWGVLQGYAW